MPFDNDKVEALLMSMPCEVAVKCVLPVVRSMVAKELTVKYGLKQTEVAKKLSVSQPAISLYRRKLRGKAIDLENDEDIRNQIQKIARRLVEDEPTRRDLIPKYCEICKTIRGKGLLCDLHKTFDSKIDLEKCRLCYGQDSLGCT